VLIVTISKITLFTWCPMSIAIGIDPSFVRGNCYFSRNWGLNNFPSFSGKVTGLDRYSFSIEKY
jgi:hypothetical protein